MIKDFDTLMITSDPCPSWHLRPHVAAGQRPLIATLPEPCSYMYLSTAAKDGRALFDALVRLTEGDPGLPKRADRRPAT